jgi:hypothetical protein
VLALIALSVSAQSSETATPTATVTCSSTAAATKTPSATATTGTATQTPSPTTTPVLPCEQRVALAASLSGLAGSTGVLTLNWSTPLLGFDPAGYCGPFPWARADWASSIVMIDLPPLALLDGELTLTTCSALSGTYTATITAGHGCPSAAYAPADRFTCIGGAGENACGKGAVVNVTVTASRRLYVLVNGRDQTANPITKFVLNYSYAPPPQSPSITRTPSHTPSSTTTPVLPCEQRVTLAAALSGMARSTTIVNLTFSPPELGFDLTGDCGSYTWARSDWASIVMIDLPPSALLGGVLGLTTCNGFSNALTATIAVGHGCPSAAYSPPEQFTCIGGASENACGKGATISVPVTASRRLYVLINGRDQPVNPITTYVLNYTYTPPTPSPTATRSSTATSTQTPSARATTGTPSQTPTTTPVLPCEQRIVIAASLSGLTGSTGVLTLPISTPVLGFDPAGDCGPYTWARADWRSALVKVDLPPSALLGGLLNLTTCSALSVAITATIAVGHGCPSAAYSPPEQFTCIGGASENACGKGATISVPVTASRRLYVLVNGRDQTASPITTFVLNYSYVPLTPSPSPSASSSLSPSSSPSQTGTRSLSPTPSKSQMSQSVTASGSQTATPSASRSATGSGSRSATPSRSRTPSPTRTPTRSVSASLPPSATATRTATRSPPLCRAPVSNVTLLVGAAGASAPLGTASSAGNAGLYTSGSCATGLRTFWPGPRLVYYLDLGPGTPLGGALAVTTCGLTANNTVLYVGTGCPTWAVPFACLAGNDDAGDDGAPPPVACSSGAAGGNARASALTLPAVQWRTFFLQVAGYGGADVTAGLAWAYRPPATPSPSRSRSRTRTASRTRSRSASRSRSRKPK